MRTLFCLLLFVPLLVSEQMARQRNAALWMVVVLLLSAAGFYYAFVSFRRKKSLQLIYERNLRREEEEKNRLSLHQIDENSRKIAHLEWQLSEARRARNQTDIESLTVHKDVLEAENREILARRQQQDVLLLKLKSHPLFLKIKENAGNESFKLEESEWNELAELIDSTFDLFTQKLSSQHRLSETELRVCYLHKMEIPQVAIASMMCRSTQAISMILSRMHYKIFGIKGSAKQMAQYIQTL